MTSANSRKKSETTGRAGSSAQVPLPSNIRFYHLSAFLSVSWRAEHSISVVVRMCEKALVAVRFAESQCFGVITIQRPTE